MMNIPHHLSPQFRSQQLENHCDLSTVEMLGKGSYGYVTGFNAVQTVGKVVTPLGIA